MLGWTSDPRGGHAPTRRSIVQAFNTENLADGDRASMEHRKRRRKLDSSPPTSSTAGVERRNTSLRIIHNSVNPSPFHLFERIPPSGKLPSPRHLCGATEFVSDQFADSSTDGFGRTAIVNPSEQFNSSTSDDNEVSLPHKPTRLFTAEGVQTHCGMMNFPDFSNETSYEQTRELIKDNESLSKAVDDLQCRLTSSNDQLVRCLDIIQALLIEKSKIEGERARRKCDEDKIRLGQYTMQRQGASFTEQWTDGFEAERLAQKQRELNKAKEEVERERKVLMKQKPVNKCPSGGPGANTAAGGFTTSSAGAAPKSGSTPMLSDQESSNDKFYDKPLIAQEWHEREEILRIRLASIRKDEMELNVDFDKLARERHLHVREIKRLEHQKNSRLQSNCTLNNRYLLLSLLGKGGFSEVHKAFDTKEMRYVACKVHQLNREWSDEKKANYIKHALREYKIHKGLDHPRIVRLFDVFEIDTNSFCTVLEYCEGNDLDFMLKQNKSFPEKESRSFITQIISALKYLNTMVKPPVIHYDLKPGNIMVGSGSKSGEVKITDFGLSKQMDEDCYDPEQGMDLTSQGAGTYWYLPPEVFVQGIDPPKISSKVDVWSVGCIFFQCLYGRKPFGHNLSQTAILENNVILKAKEIHFPPKPPTSNEAKAFIRKCLTYRVKERPDILQLAEEEYVRGFFRRGGTSASAAQAAQATGSTLYPAKQCPQTDTMATDS